MNTQIIQDIILSVLEDNDGCTLDNSQEREQVAEKVAQALTLASLEQLAALMGTNLSFDNDGQALIFTGVFDTDKADEIALSDLKVMARQDHFDTPMAGRPELGLDWSNFASDEVDPTEVP